MFWSCPTNLIELALSKLIEINQETNTFFLAYSTSGMSSLNIFLEGFRVGCSLLVGSGIKDSDFSSSSTICLLMFAMFYKISSLLISRLVVSGVGSFLSSFFWLDFYFCFDL